MFEAEDFLWEERIQENPSLAKLRNKQCCNWDTLLELYDDTHATGSHAKCHREKSTQIQRGLNFANLCLDSQDGYECPAATNEESSFGDHDISKNKDVLPGTPKIGYAHLSGGSSRSIKKRKASMMEVMEDSYKSMGSSVEKLSVALVGTGKKIAESKYEKAQNEEIYAAVDALGLDENYKIQCYCYLTAHPSKAAQITEAPGSIRKKLLDGIMASAGDD